MEFENALECFKNISLPVKSINWIYRIVICYNSTVGQYYTCIICFKINILLFNNIT